MKSLIIKFLVKKYFWEILKHLPDDKNYSIHISSKEKTFVECEEDFEIISSI